MLKPFMRLRADNPEKGRGCRKECFWRMTDGFRVLMSLSKAGKSRWRSRSSGLEHSGQDEAEKSRHFFQRLAVLLAKLHCS